MCLGLRQSLSRDQEQSSWLGRWDLYPGSRVCAPVWEEPGAGARGVGSTAGLTGSFCVSVHLGVF